MKCRHCHAPLEMDLVNLGFAPPSNAYVNEDRLSAPEVHYPLRVKVCTACWLVQTQDFTDAAELFDAEYAYFSSTSSGWLEHARGYVENVCESLGLTQDHFVMEIASNDGYLLRNFVERGIPCIGVEPTASTAAAAEAIGVPVRRAFFGEAFARGYAEGHRQADLLIGNNVYAHVPAINDFTQGLKCMLAPGGTITLEFPHLLRLLKGVQFDTIYHEHFSYLSFSVVDRVFREHGLRLHDVEELPTHGGSLRVYGSHHDDPRAVSARVERIQHVEKDEGMLAPDAYRGFQQKADRVKDGLLRFLLDQKAAGRRVAGYGAAAKGNTLLNYAGVRPDLLAYVCDAAAAKQGKYLPGSHIPILPPEVLSKEPPDVLLILPWNLAPEIRSQFAWLRERGTEFVTAVPEIVKHG